MTGCFIIPLLSLVSPLYPNLFLKDARFLLSFLLQTRAPLKDPGLQDQVAAAAASQQVTTSARFMSGSWDTQGGCCQYETRGHTGAIKGTLRLMMAVPGHDKDIKHAEIYAPMKIDIIFSFVMIPISFVL